MTLNTDKLTTVAGIGMGVCTSLQTVVAQMPPGSFMHPQDYFNLALSLFMVIGGYFSNKHQTPPAPPA